MIEFDRESSTILFDTDELTTACSSGGVPAVHTPGSQWDALFAMREAERAEIETCPKSVTEVYVKVVYAEWIRALRVHANMAADDDDNDDELKGRNRLEQDRVLPPPTDTTKTAVQSTATSIMKREWAIVYKSLSHSYSFRS
jgi:hypothetical protein